MRSVLLLKAQVGYQLAIQEVAGLGDDLAGIQRWVFDNPVQVEA